MEQEGKLLEDWWIDIWAGDRYRNELIGYPTQKPEALLERIIKASSKEGDVVADFFCGGGTTPTVAQKLNRRWIACDQSRVAVAITQGRLESLHEKNEARGTQHTLTEIPDISVEQWGTYEISKLEEYSEDEFKQFIISAYGGKLGTQADYIHGSKNKIPLFVGSPQSDIEVTKTEVLGFAEEIKKTTGKSTGIMLGWSFTSSAKNAVDTLQNKNINVEIVKITLTNIESQMFKEHITKHKDYEKFLTFILSPLVKLKCSKSTTNSTTYNFDASESISLNNGAKIISIQWDFDYTGRFTPTQGHVYKKVESYKNFEPMYNVDFKFKKLGKQKIACKVQDDLGGEKIFVEELTIK